MPDRVPIRRALISVSDKSGLLDLASGLSGLGVELISTGGTARALSQAGLPVTPVDALTGFPEMLDGRVKTLHPMVHAGLLAVRDNPEHARALARHAIRPIDLLVVNLYPFRQTVAEPGCTRESAIENIDIGGPAMIRSAAKNHEYVAVLTGPDQYGPLLEELRSAGGHLTLATRRRLCALAFAHTAEYDRAVAAYLAPDAAPAGAAEAHARFPARLSIDLPLVAHLRQGENPHQAGALYRDPAHTGPTVVGAEQLHGKELSYNNLNDAAAALDLALALAQAGAGNAPAVGACVIKHANPCGAALSGSAAFSVQRALAGDPLAAFGGILACSAVIDAPAAALMTGKDVFLEVIVAPGFTPEALEALRSRSANVRLLAVGTPGNAAGTGGAGGAGLVLRSITGGVLAQDRDALPPAPAGWTHAAGPAPSAPTLAAAAALETVVRAMASNAVAIGRVPQGGPGVELVGGGVGQVDRVTACRVAVAKARATGAAPPEGQAAAAGTGLIALSDAFFPFPDGPRVLIDAGVTTLVHPGGSKRDAETFDLCNQRGVTCMVTGVRRFRH